MLISTLLLLGCQPYHWVNVSNPEDSNAALGEQAKAQCDDALGVTEAKKMGKISFSYMMGGDYYDDLVACMNAKGFTIETHALNPFEAPPDALTPPRKKGHPPLAK
ncbi:hypothetical protein [Nitrospira sp. M1]